MKDKVKEIILAIVEDNKVKKNGRDYALLLEIKKTVGMELNKVLNEMYKNKEIIVGDTINDKWIKLNNSN